MNFNKSTSEIEFDYFEEYRLSAVIILIIVSIGGTFGNINVLAVYSKLKNSKLRLFILLLAINDLIGSSIAIPLNIVDLRYPMTMTSAIFCKITRFIAYHTTMTSGLLLIIVAFERYRKVCYPFGKQMTLKQLKIGCFTAYMISLILAIPSIYFYDSVPTNITNHPELDSGKMCGPQTTQETIPYFSGLLVIGTTVVVVESVFYICIAVSVIRWKRYKRHIFQCNANHNESAVTSPQEDSVQENSPLLNREQNIQQCCNYQTPKSLQQLNQDNAISGHEMNKMDKAARSAIMFMLVAIFSYAGYIPIILFSIIQAANTVTFLAVSSEFGTSIALLNRLYFLNNIVNPIVYGFLDATFRRKSKEMYQKLC